MMRELSSRPPGSRLCALVVTLALGFLVWTAPATAHVPILEPRDSVVDPPRPGDPFPGAVEIPDPSISRAVYGTIAAGEQYDVYRFTVPEPATIPIHVLVPVEDRLAAFQPSWALIGPGESALDGMSPLPDDARARVEDGRFVGVLEYVDGSGGGQRPTFYEPFTFERYWEGARRSVELQPSHTYYLLLFDEGGGGDGAPLPYVVGLGEREAFTLGEAAGSVVAIARIKLGLYGQSRVDVRALAILLALFTAVVGLVSIGVIALLSRRRRPRGRLGPHL
jgi:hypothetical protein